MKASDLALNRILGIRDAPAGSPHLLEMPATPALLNHVGTIHAAAQFALAEAASAECLQRHFRDLEGRVIAVVRGVQVKYRQAANGDLLGHGTVDPATTGSLRQELAARGRALAVILVDLRDRDGTLTFHGKFEWFVSLPPAASP